MSFVHLHVHTQYSLNTGIIKIRDLVSKVKALGMPAVAITDFGNAFGIYDFYKECLAQKIKPIIGCEIYLGADKHQLVLLVKNQKGFFNYSELLSLQNIEWSDLQKYHEGLICLSGNHLGDITDALKIAKQYKNLFGNDYYLELIDHGLANQKKHNQQLIEIGRQLNIQLVASNDVYYQNREDAYAQEVWMAVCDHKKISEIDRRKFFTNENYLKSSAEMRTFFSDYPEAIDNTQKIFDKINFGFSYKNRFPRMSKQDPNQELAELIKNRITLYYQDDILLKANLQAQHELEVIKNIDHAEYFLITYDYMQWAIKNHIAMGFGRGSAPSSIVNYILGITAVDPLAHGLIFERFINLENNSVPYIVSDFGVKDRDKIIEYLIHRYGRDCTALIASPIKQGIKNVLTDVAKTLDYSLTQLQPIIQSIEGIGLIYFDEFAKNKYESDSAFKEVIDIANVTKNLPISVFRHEAGIAISDTSLKEICPMTLFRGDDLPSTQLSKDEIKELGVLTIDVLGLKILDIMKQCEQSIQQNHNNDFSLNKIPLDDQKTFLLIKNGFTDGCFQLEGDGMISFLKEIKPNQFSDIPVILALHRPSALNAGVADQYISLRRGKEKYEVLFKELCPYLNETYGLILFDEQLMHIAMLVGGFSPTQADLFRKNIGKRHKENIEKMEKEFLHGASLKGFDTDKVKKLLEQCLKNHGLYNKSHAVAYGLISYRSAYLKANYPTEFMKALAKG